MKSNKKAFTIVELVVVIAIIAVLAAVLIPTFANILNKANVAKDTQLIRNLNTALASDRASNNNKNHQTFYDALQAAEAFGYDIGKINASSISNEILWDQENDVFCYLEGTNVVYLPELVDISKRLSVSPEVNPHHLWKIFDDEHPFETNPNGFSIYWNGSPLTDVVNLDGFGFDAGTSSVSRINYENNKSQERDVIIRTNGGALSIDALSDTVKHHGYADSIDVIAVASISYHEYGTVALIKLTTGRVVITGEANVANIYVAQNGAIVAIEEGTELPPVKIASNVTEFKVQTTDKEGKKKTQSNVIVTRDENGAVTEIATSASSGETAVSASVTTRIEQAKSITETELQQYESAATRYAGGIGTIDEPYLISKAEHIDVSLREDMAHAVGSYNNLTGGKYYKMIEDIDLGSNFVPLGAVNYTYESQYSATVDTSSYKNAFQGSFDGNGHIIVLCQNGNVGGLFGMVSALNFGEYIKNLTLKVNINSTGTAAALAKQFNFGGTNRNYKLENITVVGSITGFGNVAGIVNTESGLDGTVFTFKNCVNKANLTVNKMSGFGYVLCAGISSQACVTSKNETVIFESCRNEGNLVCASTGFDSSTYSIMGHMVGQSTNSSFTSGTISTMKFLNCTFKADAEIKGYSKTGGANAEFEGYDLRVDKNTYTGNANINKQLLGGRGTSSNWIDNTEYVRDTTAKDNYFAHGGTTAAPGRSNSTVANYPAN
ncbi:MAG: type II secretion system protein [Clostridia bacterium]|nr:type II secretion system protein [Clostridia bacterium]